MFDADGNPIVYDQRPGRHRRNDRDGSVRGAESVAYRAGSQKQRLLIAFHMAGDDGLTDDEAALAVSLDRSCFWKRCGELRQDGMIADTGTTRPGPLFGEQRMVSAVTALGARTAFSEVTP
jgi:hypothetical protein